MALTVAPIAQELDRVGFGTLPSRGFAAANLFQLSSIRVP
jgi:hypothetical protein